MRRISFDEFQYHIRKIRVYVSRKKRVFNILFGDLFAHFWLGVVIKDFTAAS